MARDRVLAAAGATAPTRDRLDLQVVQNVIGRSAGEVIKDPAQVGGWPELRSGRVLAHTMATACRTSGNARTAAIRAPSMPRRMSMATAGQTWRSI